MGGVGRRELIYNGEERRRFVLSSIFDRGEKERDALNKGGGFTRDVDVPRQLCREEGDGDEKNPSGK